MPQFRTEEYAIWRACERLGIRQPGVKPSWEENDVAMRETMLAYSQIREEEDNERFSGILGASVFA
jgi:hypothetical protein